MAPKPRRAADSGLAGGERIPPFLEHDRRKGGRRAQLGRCMAGTLGAALGLLLQMRSAIRHILVEQFGLIRIYVSPSTGAFRAGGPFCGGRSPAWTGLGTATLCAIRFCGAGAAARQERLVRPARRWARSWPSRCPVAEQWTNEGRLKYELVWVGNRKPSYRTRKRSSTPFLMALHRPSSRVWPDRVGRGPGPRCSRRPDRGASAAANHSGPSTLCPQRCHRAGCGASSWEGPRQNGRGGHGLRRGPRHDR